MTTDDLGVRPEARTPGGWSLCPGCDSMLYDRRLRREQGVCPHCRHHRRLGAPDRIAALFDPDDHEVVDIPVRSTDVLEFHDTRPYPERLADARATTGLDEAVLVVRGRVTGAPVVAAVMDFRFLGGSLGAAVGARVAAAADLALESRTPLLLVCASGGARMQEGALSLMQMAVTSQALTALDRAGILTLTLVTDPTYGGVAASYAALTDVVLAEPGARMGFAGPRVIRSTVGGPLPEGFQTAESLLGHGLIDAICPRQSLRPTIGLLLRMARDAAPSEPDPADTAGYLIRDPDALAVEDAGRVVRAARDIGRPSTLAVIDEICDQFVELRGDRAGTDDRALVGGLARLRDRTVMVIGHQKGDSISELNSNRFGMPGPAGYRKAVLLMRLAEKLGVPVLTMVDTPGAHPGVEAEQNGQAVAIAQSIATMGALRVPTVAMLIGEGGSGGALALSVADEVLMCSRAYYSVISPEGCASILFDDPGKAQEAAASLGLDARSLLAAGVIDGVVLEPDGGNQADPVAAARRIGGELTAAVRRLDDLPPERLRARRVARFRTFSAPARTTEEQP